MPQHDPKQRFSDRVENYVWYRPGYPAAVVELLRDECGLTPGSIVADLGSGTGILSELLLRDGCLVYGIEPNGPMREAAARLLAGHLRFRSAAGTAEATGLPDRSVDLVTAGQAFHWFDPVKARAEFLRILQPGGWVVLLWNDRRTGDSPFACAYDDLLHRCAVDYAAVNHKNLADEVFHAFFAPAGFRLRLFPNSQRFGFEGLKGRLLSSSYAPAPGQPGHEEILQALQALFDEHQTGGQVVFEYDTKVYFGRLVQSVD
jgi:SAM-dependent methyltransferase